MLDTSNLLDAILMKRDPKAVEDNLQITKNTIIEMLKNNETIKGVAPDDRIEELSQTLLSKILNEPYAKQEGKCYIHFTSGYHIDEISKILLDNGADVNLSDNKGNTPLHYIAQAYEEPLIAAMKAINPKTGEETYKIARGMVVQLLPTINLLTQYGADFSIRNNENKTPLDIISDSMIRVASIKPTFDFKPQLYIKSYENLLSSTSKEKNSHIEQLTKSRQKENKSCIMM